MKILMVNDFDTYGGAEVFYKALAGELVSRDHQVSILTKEDLPLEWHGFRYFDNSDELMKDKWFKRFIEQCAPDVIHIHNFSLIGLSPFYMARQLGIPTIYTTHDYYTFCPRRTLMRGGKHCWDDACYKCLMEKLPARKLRQLPLIKQMGERYGQRMYNKSKKLIKDALEEAKIVTISPRMKNIFQEHGYDTQTILNGLPDKIKLETDEASFGGFILHLARLSPEKGIDILQAVSKEIPIIAFNKSTLSCFETIIDSAIDYKGYRPRTEIEHALKTCSAGLSCSIWEEPCGLDILETMMHGKPVVATALGGHLDQIDDGKTGFLVEPNPSNIVSACKTLLDDEDLGRRFGEAGRRRYLERFTIERCTEEYEKVYGSL